MLHNINFWAVMTIIIISAITALVVTNLNIGRYISILSEIELELVENMKIIVINTLKNYIKK